MTQGNFINLSINKSLSYTIDAQLDKELGQDVQLNQDQWQSVFNIVKNDRATTKPQYKGGNTDINNGRNYRVKQGQAYKLTQNAWNQIKEIALQALGRTTQTQETQSAQEQPAGQTSPATEQTAVTTSETSDTTNVDPAKAQVEEILQNCEIDTSDIDINDVVNKYKTILYVNEKNGITTDQTVLENRILNYAKGLKYHNFEAKAQTNNDVEFQSDCSKATTLEDLAKSYQQFGKEYVEFMDQDGDGEINVHEMFYQELQDFYSTKNMNKTEAKRKAIETLEKFKSYNINNLPDENSELYNTKEMELFTTVMKKIGLLDADANGQISSDEAGAYLMTTAQQDGKNNIKATEAKKMEMGIAADGCSVEDLQNLDYTEQEAKNILSFSDYFKKNFSTYLEFVKTGKMPQ